MRAACLRGGRGFTLTELVLVVLVIGALASLVVPIVDEVREDAEITITRASLKAIAEGVTGSAEGTGYLDDMKHVPGFRLSAIRMHDLFSASSHPDYSEYDTSATRGWRGPYVKPGAGAANLESSRRGFFPQAEDRRRANDASYLERGFFLNESASRYGVPGDLSLADPWGNPIVIQIPPAGAFAGSSGDGKRFRYARVVSAGPDGILDTPANRLAGMLADGTTAARGDDLVLFLNRCDVHEDEEL